MIEMKNTDLNKPLEEDDAFNMEDEEDDQKQGAELTEDDAKSDEEELWFDTSAFDYELKEVRPASVGLTTSVASDSGKDSPASGASGASGRKMVTFKREGSIIRDEDFEMIPLKDGTKRSMY